MGSYADFNEKIQQLLWAWAEQHHRGRLDGGKRLNRPPVLAKQFAAEGVLVPPNRSTTEEIRAAIPASSRHRWFGSLKSSQALTQSVFGAVRALRRLDLLGTTCGSAKTPHYRQNHVGHLSRA